MRKFFLATILLFSAFASTPAASLNTKWLASNGSGTQCSRFAPCNDAFGRIAANDVFHCVDSLVMSGITSTVPWSLVCTGGEVVVNFLIFGGTAANDVVVVEGVTLECPNQNGGGVSFSGSGTLVVRNVKIINCDEGIAFRPTGSAKLRVFNVSIEKTHRAGVLIDPAGAASVQVEIDGLKAADNEGGVYVQASQGRTIEVDIRNSALSQNSNYGLVSNSGGGVSAVFLSNSSVSENSNVGVYSSGPGSYVLVNKSEIARNNIGWGFASGGTLATYANNVLSSASSFGGPSVTVGLQ